MAHTKHWVEELRQGGPMRKSVLLRRIITLLLAAVLLSGVLSAGIYILVTRQMYVQLRADELTPIARTIANMLTDAQPGDMAGHGMWPLLDRENNNFGATLHIYNAQGESSMNPENGMKPDGQGNHPGNAPLALSDEDMLALVAADLKSVLEGTEVSGTRKTAGGESYLVVGVPIQSGGEVVGAVLFTKAMQELNDAMQGLNMTLIISTIAAFMIMLIPGYFAAKHLVVPIRQMGEVARAMAKGNFAQRADESQKGEIGELGQAMNHFAAESGKLEQTRRDYVANVSHELRTPIAAIRAMGETLRDGLAKTAEKKELFYNNIVRESLRLSRLVDDLLELSRLQSGKEAMQKTQLDLREVIQNISDVYSHVAAESDIQYSVAADMERPAAVFSNADRIEQVMVILLDNAIKHSPKGGGILLSIEERGAQWEVSVSNTGETIPQEDLPYIFERFYKVDKSHSGGGTGLGLSIAKEIIKGLGEEIRAESVNGETRFVFSVGR